MGIGYGKVILFGEHFVVYGCKAIVAGMKNLTTEICVEEGPWNKELNSKVISCFESIKKTLKINKTFTVQIKDGIPLKQNLGASAAYSVAFARALNEKYKLNLSDEEINKVAYEGEKVFHGNPSGIDTSASTYGTTIEFEKVGDGKFKIQKFKIKSPLNLLIVSTGQKAKGTDELIAQVAKIKSKYTISDELFSLYGKLFDEAKIALSKGDLEKTGHLMNLNHAMLASFGLSTEKIEQARFLLFEKNALGAKITGAGGGGNIISLFKTEKEAIVAKDFMEKQGVPSLFAKIE